MKVCESKSARIRKVGSGKEQDIAHNRMCNSLKRCLDVWWWVAAQSQRTLCCNNRCEFDLGNVLPISLKLDGIRDQQLVVQAILKVKG